MHQCINTSSSVIKECSYKSINISYDTLVNEFEYLINANAKNKYQIRDIQTENNSIPISQKYISKNLSTLYCQYHWLDCQSTYVLKLSQHSLRQSEIGGTYKISSDCRRNYNILLRLLLMNMISVTGIGRTYF